MPDAHYVFLSSNERAEDLIRVVDWQTASVINKFSEYLPFRRWSDTNPQQRRSVAVLHRLNRISNQIHNDLLDLKTIYEHHEHGFLVIALNWSGPAIYVLFD